MAPAQYAEFQRLQGIPAPSMSHKATSAVHDVPYVKRAWSEVEQALAAFEPYDVRWKDVAFDLQSAQLQRSSSDRRAVDEAKTAIDRLTAGVKAARELRDEVHAEVVRSSDRHRAAIARALAAAYAADGHPRAEGKR